MATSDVDQLRAALDNVGGEARRFWRDANHRARLFEMLADVAQPGSATAGRALTAIDQSVVVVLDTIGLPRGPVRRIALVDQPALWARAA